MAYGPSKYVRMAKGLARSIRRLNPSTTLAIITDRNARSLKRWFDVVIPYNPDYGPGLAQKLHLDRYAPFDETLFIDSDFLVFKDLERIWDEFAGVDGFGLFGFRLAPGEAHYAIDDLPAYMAKLGLSQMVMTNTGILYFDRSSGAREVFEAARNLAKRGDELGLRRHPVGFFNDEPIFGTVVEMLGKSVVDSDSPVFTLGSFGTGNMVGIDVRRQESRHTYDGKSVEPAAIHFNVDSQGSWIYDRELRRLEFGRVLGSTPLPDGVTFALRAARRLRRTAGQAFARTT